jgi:hypothetical protein
MGFRAASSGISLDEDDAAIVKGMLARGDRQHDIAAWFGVNGGRIAEIATGQRFGVVKPAGGNRLPPPGPYLSGRDTAVLLHALRKAQAALHEAERFITAA